MKFVNRIGALRTAILASVFPLTLGAAAAEDGKCLRVVMFEWKSAHVIDPAAQVQNSDLAHVLAAYEYLVVLDNNYVPHPQLAESWTASPDGKSWTFKLREGVKFHNGGELTADDVVYSFKRILDPATGSLARADIAFLKPEDIVAKSKYEVEFTADAPVAELPLLLANKAAMIVQAGSTRESLQKESAGTGPFMIKDFKADGARTVLQKHPDYWEAGKPLMDCIELSGIADPLTRAATLQSGDADVLIAVDPVTIPTLQADPNVELHPAENANMMLIAMQLDQKPFNDPRVREALKLVIDREALAQIVTLGVGTPGNDNPIPISSPFSVSPEVRPRDVEKARALLAEAGQSDLTVDLYTGAQDLLPGMLALVQAYKEMAAEAGITINIVTTPNASYWDDIYMKRPFYTTYWFNRHPASSLSLGYRSDAQFNETNWRNPEFDALLDKAAATLDDAARTELYREAAKKVMEEGGAIIPVFQPLTSATRKGCTGFVPHIEIRVAFKDIVCE
jgi:peptide/nickel transport system substrate-binding protein